MKSGARASKFALIVLVVLLSVCHDDPVQPTSPASPDGTPPTIPPVDTATPPRIDTSTAPVDTIPAPVDTTTAPVDTTPARPPTHGVELPRREPMWRDPHPGKTCTISVAPGLSANVDAALQQAAAAGDGQVVCLTSGQTYQRFTIPTRTCTSDADWIVVRSTGLTVPEGTRIQPALHASQLARIEVPGVTNIGIRTAPGTCGWYLAGLEVALTGTQSYALVELGQLGGTQTMLAHVPTRIVLSRFWMHGTENGTVRRCVALHSAESAIVDSDLDLCREDGSDSQAIAGINGPGPYLIENNRLRGAGENVMFGGAPVWIPGMQPADITIRRNHIEKPASWIGLPWDIKNLIELKSGRRVLIEGNVLEGSWTANQTGWAMILRDDGNGCTWCSAQDVTVRRNLIRNVGAGINIANPVNTAVVARVHIVENVIDGIGVAPYTGERRGFQILARVQDVRIERNLTTGNMASAAVLVGGARCEFVENVWTHGQYGVVSSGTAEGVPSIEHGCGTSYVWTEQWIIGAPHSTYPTGTTWVSAEAGAPPAATIRALVQQATAGVVIP